MQAERRKPLQMIGTLAALLLLSPVAAAAQTRVDEQGNVTVPAFTVPFSGYASPEARRLFQRVIEQDRHAPPLDGPVAASRAYWDKINAARAERMERLYPVKIEKRSIGGVPVQVVTPKQGIAPAQAHRVLINLHGGAFLWGAGSGGLVESIPVASEDVAAVYRELLKQHPAKNIGIYGCSAGGGLTAEAVAWFVHAHLPLPGAIGIFCASIVDIGGDSAWVAPVMDGEPPPEAPLKFSDLPYFKGAKPNDPLVFPANSPKLLAQFPPTLLITGTRDFAMSSAIQSQRLLTNAGVDAELHVWDGMWHSFFSDPEMPESKEAYAVMVKFFDRHLGR